MNGRRARGLLQWIARATSSLPVPLSPVINTFVPENWCSRSMSARIFRMKPAAADESGDAPALHVLLRERGQTFRRGAPRRFRLLPPVDLRLELPVSLR